MSDKYGPNTAQVAAYLEQLSTLTPADWAVVGDAAWDVPGDVARAVVWDAALDAARAAALDAALDAAWAVVGDAPGDAALDAPWDAALDAAWTAPRAVGALVVRDLITVEQFEILVAPMRAAGVKFEGDC